MKSTRMEQPAPGHCPGPIPVLIQRNAGLPVNRPSLFLSIHMHYYSHSFWLIDWFYLYKRETRKSCNSLSLHFADTISCPQSSAYWSLGSIYDEDEDEGNLAHLGFTMYSCRINIYSSSHIDLHTPEISTSNNGMPFPTYQDLILTKSKHIQYDKAVLIESDKIGKKGEKSEKQEKVCPMNQVKKILTPKSYSSSNNLFCSLVTHSKQSTGSFCNLFSRSNS